MDTTNESDTLNPEVEFQSPLGFNIGDWSNKLPTEKGKYLFYGKLKKDSEMSHQFVDVWSDTLAVCNGRFWHDYNPEGHFTKVINLPKPNFK